MPQPWKKKPPRAGKPTRKTSQLVLDSNSNLNARPWWRHTTTTISDAHFELGAFAPKHSHPERSSRLRGEPVQTQTTRNRAQLLYKPICDFGNDIFIHSSSPCKQFQPNGIEAKQIASPSKIDVPRRAKHTRDNTVRPNLYIHKGQLAPRAKQTNENNSSHTRSKQYPIEKELNLSIPS
jgi:hypothetical protein